ncbi:hypothetical protein QTG54_014245 [Skeletonema marinoi]|uniref:Uncharacterized protein n=1 Tax=Skeletonema marinoi TaxID=267567 RepID=A0AAD9D6Z4_9STRA|nr:hypothetical protein QTG54_014245 [Skeletonema marinoi]
MKENQQNLDAVEEMNDEKESSYPSTPTPSTASSRSPTLNSSTSSETMFPFPVCNICGVENDVGQPNAVLEVSGQSISCGELQAAGLIGKIAATSCIDILDSSLMAPCQCSTTVMTNEYNTTKPSATPTLLMPTSPPIDLVPSHIPTYTSIVKPSSRPTVPPSLFITRIEPTIAAKVDLPSQRPSPSPSSSTHHDLAITAPSPSSTTTKKPTPSKNPSSSSLESDLVFSSRNNEGDLLNEDDNSEANAGVGIGMGLLVITPLAILVLGIIYEIKRRQRRRNRNKTVLPLRNTPISKDPVTAHKRQNATRVQNTQNVRSIPTTNAAVKDAAKETTKAVTRVDTASRRSAKCASFVKETKEATANVATSQSIRPQIITSAPTTGKTSASDATEMNEAVTRVDIDRSLKRVSIDKDASVGQEMKNTSGGGDSVQNIQVVRSIPTTCKASAEAAAETKKAATHVGNAIVVRESNESSDEMSVNSSSSTRSSGSIQSMTSLIIQKTSKNLSAKETKESSASIATQKDHVTRQIAAVVQRTQTQTARDSSRSTISVGAATEAKEVVAGVDIANRSKSEISTKGASAENETKEATNTNATNLPDEVSVNSSNSTQSSESIQSMTSLIIQKSPKSVIAAKDLKKDIDDVDVSSSPDKTRVKNTNSSRIVKKDDAATFFEMLSTLQQFFDCNGDISTDNSPSTSS